MFAIQKIRNFLNDQIYNYQEEDVYKISGGIFSQIREINKHNIKQPSKNKTDCDLELKITVQVYGAMLDLTRSFVDNNYFYTLSTHNCFLGKNKLYNIFQHSNEINNLIKDFHYFIIPNWVMSFLGYKTISFCGLYEISCAITSMPTILKNNPGILLGINNINCFNCSCLLQKYNDQWKINLCYSHKNLPLFLSVKKYGLSNSILKKVSLVFLLHAFIPKNKHQFKLISICSYKKIIFVFVLNTLSLSVNISNQGNIKLEISFSDFSQYTHKNPEIKQENAL